MKKLLLTPLPLFVLFLIPNTIFGQVPNLGAASSFALFTAAGAFSNTGATAVNGDIGTDAGAFTGFPPGVVNGQIHVADAISAQAAIDVDLAYGSLSTVTCGLVIGTSLGNGQMLTPNVYCLGGASTLNGDLILDGGCNPNAVFIIKVNGALSTTTLSRVILINSASSCNVYWQISGAVELGEGSVFRGTILANGAITLLEGAALFGRGLSRQGAIELHNNAVNIDMQPTASTITASGVTTFCTGGSVTLSGNCGGVWSTGATTASITVTTSGNYSVTNSNNCGSATSNQIMVTVNPLPICTITGSTSICSGQSTQLCTPAGAVSYLWSTGAITNCISVSTAGTYSVTVTDANGCSSICNATVTASPSPICTITGNTSICQGQSTQLCTPAGAASYLWSTGAITNCISVNTAGTYTVTVTNASGCSSICNATVNSSSICTITGNTSICQGQSTQLCTPAGAATYLWSTGAITNCISVNTAGTYSVTVTNANGCISICNATVTVNPLPICTITSNTPICQCLSIQLCTPAGAASYLWSTGAIANCLSVNPVGTYSVTVTNASGCSSICSITFP